MNYLLPLSRKFFLAMVLATLLPLLAMVLQNYFFARNTIRQIEEEHLELALKTRVLWLRTWVSHTRQEFYLTGFHTANYAQDDSGQEAALASVQHTLFELFRGHGKFRSVTLYDPSWEHVSHVPETLVQLPPLPSEELMLEVEKGGLFISGEPYYDRNGDSFIALGHTLTGSDEGSFVVAELNLTRSLRRILSDTSDLEGDGMIYLVSDSRKVLFQSPQNEAINSIETAPRILPQDMFAEPYWTVKTKVNEQGSSLYYVTAQIPEVGWYLVLQVHEDHVLSSSRKHILLSTFTASLALIIILISAAGVSCRFVKPLEKFARQVKELSKGRNQEIVNPVNEPFVDGLADSFNTLRTSLAECQEQIVQATALSKVGKLTSSLIHEMRSPLSSIRINLQALARRVRGDQVYVEMVEISLAQVNRLETLFQDMLDFSKPINIEAEKTYYSEIVEESLRTFSGAISGELLGNMSPNAKNKDISFNVVDDLAGKVLWLDRKHVCRALINLLSNAIEWSDAGTEICITGTHLPDTKQIAIEVRDSGPGFDPQVESRLFEPFYTNRKGGTGLGLTNVKKIVEYHGGMIIAKNSSQGGATFTMTFPDKSNDEQE